MDTLVPCSHAPSMPQRLRFFVVASLLLALSACGKSTFYSGGQKEKKPTPTSAGGTPGGGDAEREGGGGIAEVFGEVPPGYTHNPNTTGGNSPTPETENEHILPTPETEGERTLAGIEIPVERLTLQPGESASVPVTAVYSDGSREPVTEQATFESDKPAIATTSPDKPGVVTGVAEGDSLVTIKFGAKTKTLPVEVSPYTVVGVRVEPAVQALRVNESLQMHAIATLSSGKEIDVTAQAKWSSSQESVVSLHPLTTGLIQALKVGSAELKASFQQYDGKSQLTIVPQPYTKFEFAGIRRPSPGVLGELYITMKVLYLRPGDKAKGALSLHSVDIKPGAIVDKGLSDNPATPGWQMQTLVMKVYYKHIPENVHVRYTQQDFDFDVTYANASTYHYDYKGVNGGTFINQKVEDLDERGNPKAYPVVVFAGSAGHPQADQVSFP